jgi:uncharacterized protein YlxW (UPF0749 family)
MKKIILISLAVVALTALLLGVGDAVVHQGNKYQNKKVLAAQAKEQKVADLQKALDAEKAKSAKISTAYDHERQECEKGRGAYVALTTLSKTRAAAVATPVCGPAVLQ